MRAGREMGRGRGSARPSRPARGGCRAGGAVHRAQPCAMRTLRLVIAGRVQGVGYRDWMLGEALARGIAGWVRNRRDGTVEALVHGEDAAIESLLAACRRGPPAAAVTAVTQSPADPPAEQGFARFP